MDITKKLLKELYPKRDPWSHKGQFGKLLIIGGSKMYSGSLALAALAAIRSGCDLVSIAAPQRAADIVASFAPDLITYPLRGEWISPAHLKECLELSKNATAVVIGGGAGRHPQTMSFVRHFLHKTELPCVVDADGLRAMPHDMALNLRPNTLLTPHAQEFEVLAGTKPEQRMAKRKEQVKELASKLGCVILLKGHIDVISDGKNIATNQTGSPYLTKGGTGDTLAGIAGTFLARGRSPLLAGCAAAYINGLAGSLAAQEQGEGLMALDLVAAIPKILKL